MKWKQHPLLNPDSKHYSILDGVEAIERLEQMYTTDELAIWANITAMKYRRLRMRQERWCFERIKKNWYFGHIIALKKIKIN